MKTSFNTEKLSLNIADIIVASLTRSISGKQRAILDTWLAASDKNRDLYLRICEGLEDDKNYALFSTEDSWKLLAERLDEDSNAMPSAPKVVPLYRKLLKYAAILMLPVMLVAAAGFFFSRKDAGSSIELLASFNKQYSSKEVVWVKADGTATVIDHSFKGADDDGVKWVAPHTLIYGQGKQGNVSSLNRIIVPKGKSFTVRLSDNTTITLNAESELLFPTKFSKDSRMVVLKGEGFFSVTKNKNAPFRVKTPSYTVKVLGTTFNIKAYADDPTTTTTLCSGLVTIEGLISTSKQVELHPGQQLLENKADGRFTKSNVDAGCYTAWTDNRFQFEKVPFTTILKTLERAYNVRFVYDEEEFANDLYSCNMSRYGDIEKCLDIIKYDNNLIINKNSTTIYIKKRR